MSGWNLRNRLIPPLALAFPIPSPSPALSPSIGSPVMDDADSPSSPLPPVTEDSSARIARVEQTLQLLAEQLARLPLATPVLPTPPVFHAGPARPVATISAPIAEVPEIQVRNRRYAEVLAVSTYRLRDQSVGLRPDQVANLTGIANQVRPRLDGCLFSGEPALAVLPFLLQLVKVANQSHVSEAALLWIMEDFIRSPAKEAFRSQQFMSWPGAVHWLLTTYVPESSLDKAVRKLQMTGQLPDEDVRRFGARLQLEAAALGSLLPPHEVKSLFTQGMRDPVRSLFAANQPSLEFEDSTPLSVLIARAELLEAGTRPPDIPFQASPFSKVPTFRRSPALLLPSDDYIDEQEQEQSNEYAPLLAVQAQESPDKARWTCFVCYRIGHGWLDCHLLQHVPVTEKEEIVLRRRRYLDALKSSRAHSPRRIESSGTPASILTRPRRPPDDDRDRTPTGSPKN
jgi:hypothetical protein